MTMNAGRHCEERSDEAIQACELARGSWIATPFVLAMTEKAALSAARKDVYHQAMQRERQPAVYIMANRRNGTLYVGVTSDLPKRAWQHREGAVGGFTARYGCKLLVWFELQGDMERAILREKQIKAGSRQKKLALIEGANPEWTDLYPDIAG